MGVRYLSGGLRSDRRLPTGWLRKSVTPPWAWFRPRRGIRLPLLRSRAGVFRDQVHCLKTSRLRFCCRTSHKLVECFAIGCFAGVLWGLICLNQSRSRQTFGRENERCLFDCWIHHWASNPPFHLLGENSIGPADIQHDLFLSEHHRGWQMSHSGWFIPAAGWWIWHMLNAWEERSKGTFQHL